MACMIRSRIGIVLFVILFSATVLFAQSVGLAGQWENSHVDSQGKAHLTTYTFKVQGDTFTGTAVRNAGANSVITNGKINGNSVSFKESWPGEKMTVDAKGILDRDTLTLTRDVTGSVSMGEMILTRKKESK